MLKKMHNNFYLSAKKTKIIQELMDRDKQIILPDRISKVLTGNPHGGPCHADHHGHLVVQLECPVVNIDLIKLEVVSKITEQVSHLVVKVSPNDYSSLV